MWREPIFRQIKFETFLRSHHVIHHEICNKVHRQGSSKVRRVKSFFRWEAGTLNASQSNLDSSKFKRWRDLNENGVTSPANLKDIVSKLNRIQTWNTSTVNKSLQRWNLSIELSNPPLSNMYQQFQVGKYFRRETFPRPIPAVVCAFLWNVPLPLALEEPCGYCGYYFCSPYCASGRLLGQFPVPPMPGYRQQPEPRQAQQNHIGFRKAETLWHQLEHASSGTICVDGYCSTRPGHAWMGTNNTGVGKV